MKDSINIKAITKYLLQILFSLVVCVIVGELLMLVVFRFPLNHEHVDSAQPILDEQNTSADYPLVHAWEQFECGKIIYQR